MSVEENVFIFTEAHQDENCYIYENVTFVQDFGPWTKDQTIQYAKLDVDKGVFFECTEDGSVINQQRVGLCALPN